MAEPAPKRQRSQAQIDAFSKARAAREANLRKKFLAEQDAEQQAKKHEPVAEQEQVDDMPEPEDEQPPAQEQPEPKADAEPMQVESSDDQYVDFDVDAFKNELFERLEQQNTELKELRDHVHGVKSKQSELETSWTKHGVRTANMLNFV